MRSPRVRQQSGKLFRSLEKYFEEMVLGGRANEMQRAQKAGLRSQQPLLASYSDV
jgi:hypothetical protein